MTDRNFPAIAGKYARDIVRGKILACQWVKLACQRHLDDLERWPKATSEYHFDKAAATKVCKFIELLPHIKGKWARKKEKIVLEPWQIFFLCVVFGWKKPDGNRRFNTAYLEVGRKNAKSTLASGIALYMLTADGEEGAEVYSAATSRDQAKIVFGVSRAMARKSSDLREHYGLDVNAHNLNVIGTDSKYEALSSEGNSLDGLNIHCSVVDELHAHKTREVFDVLEGGMGSREQPLLAVITTSGSNRAGICYEQRTYVTKVLQGLVKDETYFGIIYTIDLHKDNEDDWTDPKVWIKANPNLGVSVFADDIARLCAKAMQTPSAQNPFKTKRLNIWVSADSAWMAMNKWDACAEEICIEDFEKQPCKEGLDLASKIDIVAKIMLFKKVIDNKDHYYAFGKYYLPEAAITKENNSQYEGWEIEGRLISNPGEVTDISAIEDDIKEDATRFEIEEVAYDPFQATQIAVNLSDEGFTMVEVRPTVLNFSEPMKELEALVLQGRFHHDGCPVLAWMISNVVCHLDNKDNIYPKKERPENKIDGVIALIMALARYLVNDTGPSVYEERGIRSF